MHCVEVNTEADMAASQIQTMALQQFAVMRQKDHRISLDVVVKCGAESLTNHQLLCVKVPGKGIRH